MRLFDKLRADRHLPPSLDVPVITAPEVCERATVDMQRSKMFTVDNHIMGLNLAPMFNEYWIEGTIQPRERKMNFGALIKDASQPNHPTDDWMLSVAVFSQTLVQPHGSWLIHVESDGSAMNGAEWVPVLPDGKPADQNWAKIVEMERKYTSYAMFAVTRIMDALHNRPQVDKITPAKPYRKRFAKKDVKAAEYYELKLKPVTTRYINRSGATRLTSSRRAHSVRGHFRSNRGKAIYVRAHRRGNDTIGVIKKDYKLIGDTDD